MKYVIIIVRVLLGLVFVVFGSNAFFHFIPQQPMPEKAAAFMMPLISSGYYYPIAILQIFGGICMLIGARFVPLGLTLLGPIIVNIMLFHIFIVRDGLGIAVVISVLALFLLWVYRFKFPAIFQP
jgi:putative oxidoreductase